MAEYLTVLEKDSRKETLAVTACPVSQEMRDAKFMGKVDDIKLWVAEHEGELPNRDSDIPFERTLANRYQMLRTRVKCEVNQFQTKLLPWEKNMLNP